MTRSKKKQRFTTIEVNKKEVIQPREVIRVKAKTQDQQLYIDTIHSNKITFCSGIAGTGKTKIAVSLAVEGVLDGLYDKIIITRPLVQAGEDLGHLPGDFEAKLSPYLRPIFDELEVYLNKNEIKLWQGEDKLEIAPIAYMRGRNLHNAFIVVDEAQNMTYEQLVMVLTRIGKNSKMILNGDPDQCDLQARKAGSFKYLMHKLSGINNLGTVYLDKKNVVREQIVADIVARLQEGEA